jgi:peptide/nickel transport system substrate-binding protein
MRVIASLMLAAAVGMAPAAAAEPKGTLRIATPLFAPQLANPYAGLTLPSVIAIIPAFDPLVVIDAQGTVKPWLVTSWSSTDARTWTLKLRDGVVFSNGAPLKANAIVESAAYLKTPKGLTTTTGSTFANIERAVVVDDLTVQILLMLPDPLFPQRLANWRLPEPSTWAANMDKDGESRGIGSASFVMTNDDPSRAVFKVHDKAWNTPKVARLEVRLLQEQMSRMQAFAANAVDIVMQIGPNDRQDVLAMDGRVLNRRSTRVSYVSFAKEHNPKSPINDAKVRLAMNLAVNRQAIADAILGNTVTPVGQLVLPGAPGYVPDIKPYPFDPERAKTLLAEAGYAKGLKLSVRVAPGGADEATFYQQIAQDLAKVGVEFTIIPATMAEMTRMMFKGDFGTDMAAAFGRGLDGLGDYRYRSCLGQTGIYKPYFCDPVSLEYVKKAQSATDATVLDGLMQSVTRQEYVNPPGIFLWQNNFLDGVGTNVELTTDYDAYYDWIPLHLISVKK